MNSDIIYAEDRPLSSQQFIDLLSRSSLGERRPLQDEECIDGMLKHGNLLVTAWHGDRPVGVARSVTDFHYCCYLSDLAVDSAYQKRGIGLELQRQTQRRLGPRCKVILLAAPAAASYYPRIGYQRHEGCWIVGSEEPLGSPRD